MVWCLTEHKEIFFFTFTRVHAIIYSPRRTSFFLQNHIRECPVPACHSFHSVTIKFLLDVASPNFVGRYRIFWGKHCFYFQATSQSSRFHYYRFQKVLFFSVVHQFLKFRHVTFKTVPRIITTWLLCEFVRQEEHYFRHVYGPESLYCDGSLNSVVSLTKYWHFY
jgi:hypothetical protein